MNPYLSLEQPYIDGRWSLWWPHERGSHQGNREEGGDVLKKEKKIKEEEKREREKRIRSRQKNKNISKLLFICYLKRHAMMLELKTFYYCTKIFA
jgi:hypothetical protein